MALSLNFSPKKLLWELHRLRAPCWLVSVLQETGLSPEPTQQKAERTVGQNRCSRHLSRALLHVMTSTCKVTVSLSQRRKLSPRVKKKMKTKVTMLQTLAPPTACWEDLYDPESPWFSPPHWLESEMPISSQADLGTCAAAACSCPVARNYPWPCTL